MVNTIKAMVLNGHPSVQKIINKTLAAYFTDNSNITQKNQLIRHFTPAKTQPLGPDIIKYVILQYANNNRGLVIGFDLYVVLISDFNDVNNPVNASIKLEPILRTIHRSGAVIPKNNGGFKTIYATAVTFQQAVKHARNQLRHQIRINPHFKP